MTTTIRFVYRHRHRKVFHDQALDLVVRLYTAIGQSKVHLQSRGWVIVSWRRATCISLIQIPISPLYKSAMIIACYHYWSPVIPQFIVVRIHQVTLQQKFRFCGWGLNTQSHLSRMEHSNDTDWTNRAPILRVLLGFSNFPTAHHSVEIRTILINAASSYSCHWTGDIFDILKPFANTWSTLD